MRRTSLEGGLKYTLFLSNSTDNDSICCQQLLVRSKPFNICNLFDEDQALETIQELRELVQKRCGWSGAQVLPFDNCQCYCTDRVLGYKKSHSP